MRCGWQLFREGIQLQGNHCSLPQKQIPQETFEASWETGSRTEVERRAESGIVLQPIDFYDKTIGVDASQTDRPTQTDFALSLATPVSINYSCI